MTRIAPMLLSSIVDALTPRVRKRVDAYLTDGVEVGVQTLFGQSTVRIAEVDVLCDEDEIVCDCLLAPRCAHRAVVALNLELADGTEDAEERGAVLDVPAEFAAQSGDAAAESGVGAANESGVGAWAESGPNAGVERGVGAAPESSEALAGSGPGESASPDASPAKTPGTNEAKTSGENPAKTPGMEGPATPGAKAPGSSGMGPAKTPRAGSAKIPSTSPAQAPGATAPVSAAQRDTVLLVLADLAKILQLGSTHLGALHRSMLARDLHRLRSAGLVTADRALTAYYQNLSAPPKLRVSAFASALVNLHLLSRLGPEEDASALLGQARGTYREVGGLSLVPLFAAPIITASGFAGVEATFTDASGKTWSVARVRPGDAANVESAYHVEPIWRELSAPIRLLSRHRLLVSGATARADGRLGAGSRVRASLGAESPGWESVPAPYEIVEGAILGGDRSGLVVDGRFLSLLPAARSLGAGLATELFGAALGTRVRCLVRDEELLGMLVLDGVIYVPDELSGVWWPGLDAVDRSWAGVLPEGDEEGTDSAGAEGALPGGDADEPGGLNAAGADSAGEVSGFAQVRAVLQRWCQRVLDAGPSVLSSPVLERDTAWVRAVGAPFASELLSSLKDATYEGSRRFDGTWEPDTEALARAWLAASQY